MKLTYFSKLVVIIFAFLVLGYNYSLTHRYPSVPDFQQYPNAEQQRAAFFSYLEPLVEANNQDLMRMHQHIIELHNKFTKTQQLSLEDIYWLVFLYAKVKRFDPYQQQQWQDELSKVDIVPTAIVLKHVVAIQHNTSDSKRLLQNNNPLSMYYLPDKCDFSRMLLGEKKFSDPGCFYSIQLRYAMTYLPKNSEIIKYPNSQEAFADYLWAINTSPAFADFRMLRANRRAKNDSMDDWDSPAAYEMSDPRRLLKQKNYEVTQ